MKKTKIFKSGNSLVDRIPKDYKLDTEEVYITKYDNKLIIFPEKEDFLKDRNQPKSEKRELF